MGYIFDVVYVVPIPKTDTPGYKLRCWKVTVGGNLAKPR